MRLARQGGAPRWACQVAMGLWVWRNRHRPWVREAWRQLRDG